MAISVVNGYLCMNGCDAAKARTGQDPHPATDAQRHIASDNNQTNGSYRPAVVYGGVLASTNANTVNPASASTGTSTQPGNSSVNLLA